MRIFAFVALVKTAQQQQRRFGSGGARDYKASSFARLHLNRYISECNLIPIYNSAIPDKLQWISHPPLSLSLRIYIRIDRAVAPLSLSLFPLVEYQRARSEKVARSRGISSFLRPRDVKDRVDTRKSARLARRTTADFQQCAVFSSPRRMSS